jgi:hypothetical protein
MENLSQIFHPNIVIPGLQFELVTPSKDNITFISE